MKNLKKSCTKICDQFYYVIAWGGGNFCNEKLFCIRTIFQIFLIINWTFVVTHHNRRHNRFLRSSRSRQRIPLRGGCFFLLDQFLVLSKRIGHHFERRSVRKAPRTVRRQRLEEIGPPVKKPKNRVQKRPNLALVLQNAQQCLIINSAVPHFPGSHHSGAQTHQNLAALDRNWHTGTAGNDDAWRNAERGRREEGKGREVKWSEEGKGNSITSDLVG